MGASEWTLEVRVRLALARSRSFVLFQRKYVKI